MSTLGQRWAQAPRAIRWALVGGVVVAAYFGVVEPAIDTMLKLNSRTESRIAALTAFDRQQQAREGADRAASRAVESFGMVEPPGEPSARSGAFNKAINKILEDNQIASPTITTREVPLPLSTLANAVAPDERVEKITREITFDSTPEQMARVLADLERTPEVAGVPRVQARPITDKPGRLLRVTITAEAWQTKKKGKSK